MRELHVIALSEDGRSVLLATSKDARAGGFRVALDPRLAAAVRGDLPRTGEEAVRDSALTPRDIQARLRAGETADQIAADAGVPVARVERFAGPVASERMRIIDQVQSGHVLHSRRGPSALPLGAAVEMHLATTAALHPETIEWSTRREQEGTWLVELSYVARTRSRTAAWRYDPGSRSVTAVDADSADFGHADDEEAAELRTAGSSMRAAARPAKAKRVNPKRVNPKRVTAKPVNAQRVNVEPVETPPAEDALFEAVPFEAAPTEAVPFEAAPTEAATDAVANEAASEAATTEPATSTPSKPAATPSPEPREEVGAPLLRVVPSRRAATQAPAKRAADGGRSRASLPTWADVLMGAAPPAERGADD